MLDPILFAVILATTFDGMSLGIRAVLATTIWIRMVDNRGMPIGAVSFFGAKLYIVNFDSSVTDIPRAREVTFAKEISVRGKINR